MIRFALVTSLVASAVSALAVGPAAASDCGVAAPLAGAMYVDSSLVALYESGQTFPDFLEATRSRREGWHRITDSVAIADSMVARANAVGGSWRLLIVAVDACGDSMQQVPYAAQLAARVDGLDVRIVLPGPGAGVQETHRSLDGRKATPTFVLIDAGGNEAGCYVELPREIREWTHARLDSLTREDRYAYRADWYAADKGAGVVREVVELMESARSGTPMCERGQP